MDAPMICVYDFRDQHETIKAMQETSLGDSDLGLAPHPLVASEEWWQAIEAGELSIARSDGLITKVYWASMADWPEFEMRATGNDPSTWTREGDPRRYVAGLRVRVDYVEHPWKSEFSMTGTTHSQVKLGVWVEDSRRRAEGIAPGPGGAGHELARQHGAATHYLYMPDQANGQAVLSELEQQGRVGRLWGGGTANLWIVQIWTATAESARAEATELDHFVRRYGGTYDGGEIIAGDVWGPVTTSGPGDSPNT